MQAYHQHKQAAVAPMQDEPVDFGRMLRAVLRFKWAILGLAIASTTLVALWAFTLQPIYQATVSIVMEPQEARVVSVDQMYAPGYQEHDYYQTQYEILQSRSVAEQVVLRLQLQQHPYFVSVLPQQVEPRGGFSLQTLLPASQKKPPEQLTPAQLEERSVQWATDYVAAGLHVVPVEYSYLVYLNFDAADPRLAADIVNTAAQAFIDGNLENRLSGTLQATDWLSERLAYLKQSLRESEQALQQFRDREELVDVAGVTGPGGNELQMLSQRLQDASRARMEAQNIMQSLQGMTNASTDTLMSVPAVLQHELVRDLKREQSRIERKAVELAQRYGVKHPQMIAAQADLAAANDDLALEVRKVVSGITQEYRLAARNEQELQALWDARKDEIQDFNRVEFQLRELQREVETNRQLYDIFFTRIRSMSETGNFEKPHARIVDRALVPQYPVAPNKQRIIVLAFVLSLLVACALACLLDILDNTIKSPDDVIDKLQEPLLGVLPAQAVANAGTFEQLWQNSQSDYAESIRTLRTGILLSRMDNPAQVIVVTSTVLGEGKSTIALNLASALGQMEKTLLLEGDMRRPSLAKKCALSPKHCGLSHFVSGAAQLEECIEYLEEPKLHLMPAGVIPPNPLEMISSQRFIAALATLRGKYDRIVIDSAPVQAVSDALVLASHAEAVVYAVKADSTSVTQVQKGIARLKDSGDPFIGVVLNQLNAKQHRRFYGAEGYYSAYGSSDDATQV